MADLGKRLGAVNPLSTLVPKQQEERKPEGHQSAAPAPIRKADTRTAAPEAPSGETLKAARKNAPEGYQVNPAYVAKYIEKRARRVQVVMTPSLYEAVKAMATAEGLTVNSFIHATLEAAIKAE